MMKVQSQLFAIALLLTTSVSGLAGLSAEQKREHLRMLRAGRLGPVNVTSLDRAYLDALSILDEQGLCADFFGGHAAEHVLEELVIELREQRISNTSIGIRMSGPFTSLADAEQTISYRLFANAEVNTEGPFCKSKVFPPDPFVPGVGSFQPNTRQVRVPILLHELAHLIRSKDGAWLIPDDGDHPQLSRQNSKTVEFRCGKQLRDL